MAETGREQWGHRFGYLMAVLGAMVGAGNIWRMPYVTGQNGGGAFVVALLIILFLVTIPGLMAETAMGRHTGRGVIGAFRSIYGNSRLVGLGLIVVVVDILLTSYYSPIVGWSLYYAAHSVMGTFSQPGMDAGELWDHFSSNIGLQIVMHSLTMIIVMSVLVFGIRSGIERMVKWAMPFLLIALVAVSIRGLTLPGAMEGLAFTFTPHWEDLAKGSTWLAALGQALFSNGLGWGIALTLGSYLGRDDDVPLGGGLFTAVGNTSFGLLALFAVFPAVFAFGISPTSGSELAFVALASAFGKMPGSYVWALLFFISFFFATLTTALIITEVGVTTYKEERGTTRTKAVLTIGGIIWILGLPSAVNSSVLDYLDFVVGNWGLPLATLVMMIAAGWHFNASRLRLLSVNRGAGMYIPRFWETMIRYEIPVVIIGIMLIFFFTKITTDPGKTISGIIVLTVVAIACIFIVSRDGKLPFQTQATGGHSP